MAKLLFKIKTYNDCLSESCAWLNNNAFPLISAPGAY